MTLPEKLVTWRYSENLVVSTVLGHVTNVTSFFKSVCKIRFHNLFIFGKQEIKYIGFPKKLVTRVTDPQTLGITGFVV